jgi:hypothetical protein
MLRQINSGDDRNNIECYLNQPKVIEIFFPLQQIQMMILCVFMCFSSVKIVGMLKCCGIFYSLIQVSSLT